MALFELEDGRLVPAQFGRKIADGFTDTILDAVRAQVLDIVSRPLFPITWTDIKLGDGTTVPRLTALDAAGQVVAVEVVRTLSADGLIESLSRLADSANKSWSDLASEYALGPEGFKREWGNFRGAMPTSPPNGPRLILVATEIATEVRPALDVLSSSGVEVHSMTLRQMSSGRAFLEVEAVGPRLYGHRANTLLETSAVLPAIDALAQDSTPKQAAPKQVSSQGVKSAPAAAVSRPEPRVEPRPVPTTRTRPAPPPIPRRRSTQMEPAATHTGVIPQVPATRSASQVPNSPHPSRRLAASSTPLGAPQRGSHRIQSQDGPVRPLRRDALGLTALARMNGSDIPLALRPGNRTPKGSYLAANGQICVPSGRFSDPTSALRSEGIYGEDGWSAWCLGDEYGPTLAEAIQEVNRG